MNVFNFALSPLVVLHVFFLLLSIPLATLFVVVAIRLAAVSLIMHYPIHKFIFFSVVVVVVLGFLCCYYHIFYVICLFFRMHEKRIEELSMWNTSLKVCLCLCQLSIHSFLILSVTNFISFGIIFLRHVA